jgi:hypothetical protein
MDMSRWAANALAACSLELDSLAYHGIRSTPPDGPASHCRPSGWSDRPATAGTEPHVPDDPATVGA